MSQTFTEAEIRASVVFQLSELVSGLLKAARATSGSPEWDAMVAGPPHSSGSRLNIKVLVYGTSAIPYHCGHQGRTCCMGCPSCC